MRVWASGYTATAFQPPSSYACLDTWPSQSDWDRAFLLLLSLIPFFNHAWVFGLVYYYYYYYYYYFLNMSSNIVLFYSPTSQSNKITLPFFCTLHYFMSSSFMGYWWSVFWDRDGVEVHKHAKITNIWPF